MRQLEAPIEGVMSSPLPLFNAATRHTPKHPLPLVHSHQVGLPHDALKHHCPHHLGAVDRVHVDQRLVVVKQRHLVGRLVMIGWSVGWLVGWLVGWFWSVAYMMMG
jgi:hypothetical protein